MGQKRYSKEEVINIIIWFQNEFIISEMNSKKRSYQTWALKVLMTRIMNSDEDPLTVTYLVRDRFLKAHLEHKDRMLGVAYDICDAVVDLLV